ncbi:MAG: hypothetical protein ACRC7V_08345 [Lachnospiraceae bacterium]
MNKIQKKNINKINYILYVILGSFILRFISANQTGNYENGYLAICISYFSIWFVLLSITMFYSLKNIVKHKLERESFNKIKENVCKIVGVQVFILVIFLIFHLLFSNKISIYLIGNENLGLNIKLFSICIVISSITASVFGYAIGKKIKIYYEMFFLLPIVIFSVLSLFLPKIFSNYGVKVSELLKNTQFVSLYSVSGIISSLLIAFSITLVALFLFVFIEHKKEMQDLSLNYHTRKSRTIVELVEELLVFMKLYFLPFTSSMLFLLLLVFCLRFSEGTNLTQINRLGVYFRVCTTSILLPIFLLTYHSNNMLRKVNENKTSAGKIFASICMLSFPLVSFFAGTATPFIQTFFVEQNKDVYMWFVKDAFFIFLIPTLYFITLYHKSLKNNNIITFSYFSSFLVVIFIFLLFLRTKHELVESFQIMNLLFYAIAFGIQFFMIRRERKFIVPYYKGIVFPAVSAVLVFAVQKLLILVVLKQVSSILVLILSFIITFILYVVIVNKLSVFIKRE